MANADTWVHPTRFTGEYPHGFGGFTFLDWDSNSKVYHPGEDYNFGGGNDDMGQPAVATSAGTVIHTSEMKSGYGKIVILKHTLGYNLRRFIKETYNIDLTELYSIYAHLQDIIVKVGDYLEGGAQVGHVGSSGNSKTSHLHFEIYAPIGELATKDWRFYPIGWSKEKIQEYWLPAYKFIEATKNMESYENFMGKSKEYWLTLEKDYTALAETLKNSDIHWSKKVQNAENKFSSQVDETAKCQVELKKLDVSTKKAYKKLGDKITRKENKVKKIKIRNSEILDNNSQVYGFVELFKLMVKSIIGR